uniref:Uncharacterized protein n=1 Tax=Glossina pallidipes TaxID=7398 RepID=A0A1A9ZDR7_GLOPL
MKKNFKECVGIHFERCTFHASLLTIDSDVIEVAAGIADTNLNCEDFDHHVTDHFTELYKKKTKAIILAKITRYQIRLEIKSPFEGENFFETLSHRKFKKFNMDLFRSIILSRGINSDEAVQQRIDAIVWLDVKPFTLDIETMIDAMTKLIPPPPPPHPCTLANEHYTLKEINSTYLIYGDYFVNRRWARFRNLLIEPSTKDIYAKAPISNTNHLTYVKHIITLEAVINDASFAVYVRDINKANNHQKAVQSRREEALQKCTTWAEDHNSHPVWSLCTTKENF